MDFGLDKLVEMIEERFGRRAGTIVLAAVGVAAFSFALHAFFAYLVLPIVRYAPDFLGNFGTALKRLTVVDLVYGAIQLGLGLLGVAVFYAISARIRRWHRRETQKILVETHNIISDCEAFSERNHAKLEEASIRVETELREMISEARLAAKKIIQEAEEKAAEIAANARAP